MDKALQLSNAETAAYNEMIEASNNWTDRSNDQQRIAFEQARDKWHQAVQAMNEEFTAHPECFAAFRAQW